MNSIYRLCVRILERMYIVTVSCHAQWCIFSVISLSCGCSQGLGKEEGFWCAVVCNAKFAGSFPCQLWCFGVWCFSFFFLFCEHGCALFWVSFVSSSVLFPGVLPEVVFRDWLLTSWQLMVSKLAIGKWVSHIQMQGLFTSFSYCPKADIRKADYFLLVKRCNYAILSFL